MTNFTDVFIRRPVFAMSLSLLLLVIGIAAFSQMPVRQYPLIATSTINVSTTYPGASAELMTGFVTTPLENAVGSVEGIDYMTSSNTQNLSQITVNLLLGYPIETAITDVGNEVNSVLWQLPKEIQNPVITKQDPSAQPTVWIAFTSDTLSPEAITDYLLRVIQPQISTLPGVSQAQIYGEREYAMRLNLDLEKMAAYNLTASDVYSALAMQNLQAPTGTVYGRYQQFNVVTNSDMSQPEEFDNMVIKNVNGNLIRLKDIGKASLGALNYNTSAIIDGKSAIVIGVIPTSDANPLAVSQETEALLPSLIKNAPKGLNIYVPYDSSVFISASIEEVYKTMIEASIFVFIVIFCFLGSFRSVLIPIVTIPLSLIGVCGIMLALGYSINTITLLAWVLAIGLVVDDAIVVLENIYRHLEEGLNPIPAGIVGAREIGFAIVAMTLTLAAVYAPIGFTGGLTGILFSEFAFTLAGSVIVSGFVALTLSPMMCTRILRFDDSPKSITKRIDAFFETVIIKYKHLLRNVLNYRKYVIGLGIFLYLLCGYLFLTTHSELAPYEDQGVVLIWVLGPSPASIQFTSKYDDMMIPIFQKIPEMTHFGIVNGYGNNSAQGIGFVNLVDWSKRKRSAGQIQMSIAPLLQAIPGLSIFPIQPTPLPTPGGIMPLQFVLKSIEGIDRLAPAMAGLRAAARANPGFLNNETDLKLDMPQIKMVIDREKAGSLGIRVKDITDSLGVLLGQPQNIQFSIQERGYYVVPEYTTNFNFQANPDDLDKVYVHTQNGSGPVIPLSTVVKITEEVAPQSINHFQQLPSATLDANIAPGYPLGSALKYLENYVTKNFPDVQYDFAGQARQYVEAKSAMVWVMLFALIFIFLLLAAQFESFRDPLIILGVVPLTLAGAMITIRLTGGTLNIYSEIGLTTLIGLIAKHGILIVEFSNQMQERGFERTEAVIEAASLRLRPILMTTAAMVLGAYPLAIATGAGAAARHAIGWVIVGGMLIGTTFSLFVVPAVYSLLAKVKVHDVKLEKEISDAIALTQKRKDEEGSSGH